MPSPYYLRPGDTHLPEGHDETLDPSEEPTDAARRGVPEIIWPRRDASPGPRGPRDGPAAPPPTDSARRALPPFHWPALPGPVIPNRSLRELGVPVPDLDPDVAMWPVTPVQRWPFSGPPAVGIWPLGWMGIDNTATMWICTQGGQPGTWIAVGGTGASGTFNVRGFGATGNGTTDDTAAILAAIAAANTVPHGTVYYPPGVYNVSQPLQYYPYTTWDGVPGASIIKLTGDLWAGGTNLAAHFITPNGGPDAFPHQGPCVIRGLTIYGPTSVPLGQVTNKTVGLQTATHCYYEHLFISGFFAGIQVASNHETFYACYSTGNYYNLEVKQPSTSGDQSFYSTWLDGCGLASIHIESPSALLAAIFNKTHAGFGPVGIFKTDAQNLTSPWDGLGNPNYVGGASSSSVPIVGCIFNEMSNEMVGNGAMIDTSTLGLFALRTRFNAVSWSFNAANLTTNAPLNSADYQGAWGINTRGMDLLTVFDQVNQGYLGAPGSAGVIKVTGPIPSNPVVRTSSLPAQFFGSGTNWSSVGSGGKFIMDGWLGAVGDALTFPTPGVNPINVGDCLELVTGASPQVQRATGTKPFFGVALTPTPGGGQAATVAVFVRGVVQINTPTASLATNTPLYLSTGTPYMVDATSTTNPAVGFAMQTGGTSSVIVQLNR